MAVDVQIVPPTSERVLELAANMRPADVAEVRASGDLEPLTAITGSLQCSSSSHALLFDGRVAAIWGVCPCVVGRAALVNVGVAWVLTSSEVDRHPKAFWRACRRELPPLFGPYSVLINFVHARYPAALRWVKRLGFHVEPPVRWGAANEDFCFVHIRREDLHV